MRIADMGWTGEGADATNDSSFNRYDRVRPGATNLCVLWWRPAARLALIWAASLTCVFARSRFQFVREEFAGPLLSASSLSRKTAPMRSGRVIWSSYIHVEP